MKERNTRDCLSQLAIGNVGIATWVNMAEWIVSAEESGIKLSAFLKSKLTEYSARQLKAAVDAGQCLVNGKVERFASFFVGKGDRISLEITQERRPQLEMQSLGSQERLLYVDDDIVAFDKPPGIPSEDGKLLETLNKRFAHLILLHRLDKDTTGVLLFARNDKAARWMLEQFKQRKVDKTYVALVDGTPKKLNGVVDNYLGKLSVYHGQTLWGEVSADKGSHARTTWEVEKMGKEAALIRCHPETGRTHQIRWSTGSPNDPPPAATI